MIEERTIRLSICIPTYNFGSFIGETLESILPQVTEGVVTEYWPYGLRRAGALERFHALIAERPDTGT